MKQRGYFAVGVFNPKKEVNVGSLWRSASIFGAAYIFTIGARYHKQSSDTMKSYRHIPLYTYSDFDDFYEHMPYDCQLIGVELSKDAIDLATFRHPERAIYLLGAEDHGLPPSVLERCQHVLQLQGDYCLNVAIAGSIALYHRVGGFNGLADRDSIPNSKMDVPQAEQVATESVSCGNHSHLLS